MRATLAAAAYLLAALAFLFAARDAFACGYCVEDRMAAVYDHAIVVRALERKHRVAFLAIEGAVPQAGELRRSIESELGTVKSIDRGTAVPGKRLAFLCLRSGPTRARTDHEHVGKEAYRERLEPIDPARDRRRPCPEQGGRALELRAPQP
jgi:hypothetical protein